jgi:hypothetical protein
MPGLWVLVHSGESALGNSLNWIPMFIGETGKPLFIRSKMLGISRTCSFELERTYMIILVTYCWPVAKEILWSNQSAHGLKSFPNVCDIDIEVSRKYSNERLLCSIRNQVLSTHRFRYPARISWFWVQWHPETRMVITRKAYVWW